MPIRLERLTSPEVLALDKGKSVVFLVVSTLEDHGPHLPFGTDLIEAEAIAERVAQLAENSPERYQVVFYPRAALAIDTSTSRFAVRVRGHVLRDYLIDVCDSLFRMGFKNFVCFTGTYTPSHLTAIEEAGAWLRRKHRKLWNRGIAPTLVSASSVFIDDSAKSESGFWMNPSEHGGARDTSVVLATDPQSVNTAYRDLPPYLRLSRGFGRWWEKTQGRVEGYWGSPSEAQAKRGQELIEQRAQELYPKLRAVWSGANPVAAFKSWYSLYPSNRSLFRIWVLLIGLLALGAMWLGMMLKVVTQNAG